MTLRVKMAVLLFSLSLLSANANTVGWNPPLVNQPKQLRSVYMDFVSVGSAAIQVRFIGESTDQRHEFNAGDELQLSRANALLSILMTAYATGQGVHLYSPSSTSFTAVILGSPNL